MELSQLVFLQEMGRDKDPSTLTKSLGHLLPKVGLGLRVHIQFSPGFVFFSVIEI
jgi:hypothetical protein